MRLDLFHKFVLHNHVIRMIGIYFIWITIHFYSAHIYSNLCAPYTVVGYVMSPFINSSPYCKALRWCILNGSEAIQTMWIVIGTFFTSLLIG